MIYDLDHKRAQDGEMLTEGEWLFTFVPVILLALIFLLAGTAYGGEPGTSCTDLHYDTRTLCTLSDGSGVDTDYSYGMAETIYKDPAEWHAHYIQVMKLDADYLRERAAILDAGNKRKAAIAKYGERYYEKAQACEQHGGKWSLAFHSCKGGK